jgi:hypothetical protein
VVGVSNIEGGNSRITRRKRWPSPGRVRYPDPRGNPGQGRHRWPVPQLTVTENEFMAQIQEAAAYAGWRLQYHTHDSRRSAEGFPDLVLIHEKLGRLVVAELKSEKGRVPPEQVRWIKGLRNAGVAAYIWRPSDWAELCGVLGIVATL